jgi:ribosomal protein S27E
MTICQKISKKGDFWLYFSPEKLTSFLKVKCDCCNYTIGFSEYEQIIIHETEIKICEDCKS